MTKLVWSDIRETLDLEAVMDELGIRVDRFANGEHIASCPLPSHPGADANPSFSINNDSCFWHCFTCDEGGGLPLLVARIFEWSGSEDDIDARNQSLEWLAQFSDYILYDEEDKQFLDRLQRLVSDSEPPRWTRRPILPIFTTEALERLPLAPVHLLEKWHIRKETTVEDFEIRYDENSIRYTPDAKETYTGPALVIPHFFEEKLIGYQRRWLDETRPNWVPKYTNTTNFPKKETLFAWDSALVAANLGIPVTVVESVMTAIRLWELVIPAVATFGASVKPRQIELLSAIPHLILSFDNDKTGKKALNKMATELSLNSDVSIMDDIPIEKGDLADLNDEEIYRLWRKRTQPLF